MLYWLTRVAVSWGVIAAAFALVSLSWWLAPLAWVVVGSRQHALSILGHDAVHRRGALNDRLANVLCMWPISADLRAYRTLHLAHHRHLGTAADPDAWLYEASSDPRRGRRLALDLVGGGAGDAVRALMSVRAPWGVWAANVGMGAALAMAGLWYVPALWWGSLFTSYWAVFRLRVYTEHVGADGGTHRLTRPPLWRRWLYLPELTWMHYEHHASPRMRLCDLARKSGDAPP